MDVNNLISIAKNISEIAPQAYSDVIQKPAQNIGYTLGTITELLNTLLTPIEIINKTVSIKKEKFFEEYKNNINSIPKDKLCPANFAVVAPMIDHLKYKITEDELRQKYAKLISEASNSDSLTKPLLSFDNVLDQFSPYEIELLASLFSNNVDQCYPLASIIRTSKIGYNLLYENISNISFKDFNWNTISIMISNFERVGIINIDHMHFIEPEKEIYSYVTNSDLYNQIKTECDQVRTDIKRIYPESSIEKYMFSLTEFGKSFVTTVIL
jgi:hypothetical protein